jgi:hypothetical protein
MTAFNDLISNADSKCRFPLKSATPTTNSSNGTMRPPDACRPIFGHDAIRLAESRLHGLRMEGRYGGTSLARGSGCFLLLTNQCATSQSARDVKITGFSTPHGSTPGRTTHRIRAPHRLSLALQLLRQ